MINGIEFIESIGIYVLIGFFAQMIDGSLGMAYGVISSSFLMGFGVSPAMASAAIHFAEIFTTGVSGIAHFKLGNIDKDLLKKLLIPGVIGGAIGAITLSTFDGKVLKPYIAFFLLLMGVRIFIKALRMYRKSSSHTSGLKDENKNLKGKVEKERKFLFSLALFGGFFDATGGGGWGPIVTSTLLANGEKPRKTIGSVNTAEFFVTIVQVIVFVTMLKMTNWYIIFGLIIGGVIAAPFGAMLVKKIPAKVIMLLIGILICFLQIRTLYNTWF